MRIAAWCRSNLGNANNKNTIRTDQSNSDAISNASAPTLDPIPYREDSISTLRECAKYKGKGEAGKHAEDAGNMSLDELTRYQQKH